LPRGDEWRGRGIPDEGIELANKNLEMLRPHDQIAQAIWSLDAALNNFSKPYRETSPREG